MGPNSLPVCSAPTLFPPSWVGEVAREVMDVLQLPGALLSYKEGSDSAASQMERTITVCNREGGGGRGPVRGERPRRMEWCPGAQTPWASSELTLSKQVRGCAGTPHCPDWSPLGTKSQGMVCPHVPTETHWVCSGSSAWGASDSGGCPGDLLPCPGLLLPTWAQSALSGRKGPQVNDWCPHL